MVVSNNTQDDNRVTLDLDQAIEYGVALREQGDLEAARELFRRILDAIPDQITALNCLGVLEHQLGQSDVGVSHLQRALALDPAYIDAHNNLGNLYREGGNDAEARACYERALAIDPDFPSALWNVAEIYRKADDFAQAIPLYKRAAALWPTSARVLETLGMCLRITGQSEEAAVVFRHWLELEPDSATARHLLAAISGENVPERAADEFVCHLFDGFADNFDERLARLEYKAPALVAAAVAERCGDPSASFDVLDLGCGTGLCGPALRPYAQRLVGLDLSTGMLDRARHRACYDELVESELLAYLRACGSRFDLIISADTLCYLGRLDEVIARAAHALEPGGWMIFTVEASTASDTRDYRLCPHGRYSHAETYLERCAANAGLRLVAVEKVELRKENKQAVDGFLVVARHRAA